MTGETLVGGSRELVANGMGNVAAKRMKPTPKQPTERAAAEVPVPGKDTVTSQVLALARKLQGDFLHKIRKTGLTPSQANVLRELALAPGLAQHELASRLEIGKVSAGEALIKLEQAGYVRRERCGSNRRLVRVMLTPSGEVALQALSRAAQDQIEQLQDCVGKEKLDLLARLLGEVNEAVRSKRPVSSIE